MYSIFPSVSSASVKSTVTVVEYVNEAVESVAGKIFSSFTFEINSRL